MLAVFTTILLTALPGFLVATGSCPEEYQRFSKQHSFCKPANPSCKFISRGVHDQAEIQEILKIHNDYRSGVAMGKERLAGGLPTASNMLELTWDPELSKIAQKWAEQCNFAHDCLECKSTKSYLVGQNIAYWPYFCDNAGQCPVKKPDWKGMIKMFYDEVKDFNKAMVNSVNVFGGKMIGHFTQVVWAETYKVGCGYVAYKDGDKAKQFYVCNYGPAGNRQNEPLYIQGAPCKACPSNSCCDRTCRGKGPVYPGLCKITSGQAPVYTPKQKPFYLCTFQKADPNCAYTANGAGQWILLNTAGGTFLTVTMKKSGSASVHFRNPVNVKKGSCLVITQRRGPTIAGNADKSSTEVEFEQNGKKTSHTLFTFLWGDFMDAKVPINLDGKIKFSIKFTVPQGAPPQLIEIKKIEINAGPCNFSGK